jgi:hypothetical protein
MVPGNKRLNKRQKDRTNRPICRGTGKAGGTDGGRYDREDSGVISGDSFHGSFDLSFPQG